MSVVACRSIKSKSGGAITISSGTTVINPQSVLQTLLIRTDSFTTYSSPPNTGGTRITDLNLVITPKRSDSLLIMQWMLNGEVNHDNVFLIHKNDALITDSGYQGRNSLGGTSTWVGYVPANYENNTASTAACYFIQYAIPSGSTNQQTFCPATQSSSGTTHTFYLNRTVSNAGAAAYENMVSTGKIMEILL